MFNYGKAKARIRFHEPGGQQIAGSSLREGYPTAEDLRK
jgi:hypothetical protein